MKIRYFTALFLSVAMLFSLLPVQIFAYSDTTKATNNTNTFSALEMTQEAENFWNKLECKEKQLLSDTKGNVSSFMQKIYKLISETDNVSELKFEDSDTLTFKLSTGIPCVYDYTLRNTDKPSETVSIKQTVEKNDSENGNIYLFGPFYGIDSSFTQYYNKLAGNLKETINGNLYSYSGTDATPKAIREAVADQNAAALLFDSHGASAYNTSYLCVNSNVGIETEDYSNYSAVSMGEHTYGIDGTYMTNGNIDAASNAMFWFAICESMKTNGLCQPLIDAGASVVYGYSQSVTFIGEYKYASTFWDCMMNGKTVKQSIETMKNTWGNYDPGTTGNIAPAYPIVVSQNDPYPSNPDTAQTVNSTWQFTDNIDGSYTLAYNANGGENAPQTQEGLSSYMVSMINVPSRFNYNFAGWALQQNATEPNFIPGEKIYLDSDTTLYAVWNTPLVLSVGNTYTANIEIARDALYTSFTAPTSSTYTYTSFCDVNSGDPYIVLYSESGTQLKYNDDSADDSNFILSYDMVANQTYIAKICMYGSATGSYTFTISGDSGAPQEYTLSYNTNGSNDTIETQTGASEYTVTSTVPKKFPETFIGWAYNSTATAPNLLPGDTITLSQDTVLYAVWQEAEQLTTRSTQQTSIDFAGQVKYYKFLSKTADTYVFTANGSSLSSATAYKPSGSVLSSASGNTENINFKLSVDLDMNESMYLAVSLNDAATSEFEFSIWGGNYYITYDLNGAPGTFPQQTGSNIYIIPYTTPEYLGHTFMGWATTSTATEAECLPGIPVRLYSDFTFYAVWKDAEVIGENTEYLAIILFAYQRVYKEFIPTETREYRIYPTNNTDTAIIEVYTENGSKIEANSNRYILNAGEKYYIVLSRKTASDGLFNYIIKPFIPAVTYDANGGENAPEQVEGATQISMEQPSKTGFTFMGWATEKDAQQATYLPGNDILVEDDITLYAVWEAATELSVENNSIESKPAFAEQLVWFSFTPESSATYKISCSGESAVTFEVFSADGQQIATSSDISEIVMLFAENTTYFIAVKADNNQTSIFTISLTKMAVVTFVNSISGESVISITIESGCALTDADIPTCEGTDDYVFTGWNYNGEEITEDVQITSNFALLGDINLDSVVNTGDAVLLLKFAAGLVEFNDTELKLADTTRDVEVNTGDAVAILKFAAGMIEKF